MPQEPPLKRAFAFIDGQNLFHAAKCAFAVGYPSYDPLLLATEICKIKAWQLQKVYFYTGIPDPATNPFWNHFWSAKMAVMGTRGIQTFSRHLKYHPQQVNLPDGSTTTILVGHEKGVDIRIALDMVRLARESQYDVALLFSQDQDLTEAVDEVKQISIAQNRWIKIACAYPASPACKHVRGVNGTDWFKIDVNLYNACIDPKDYRPKKP